MWLMLILAECAAYTFTHNILKGTYSYVDSLRVIVGVECTIQPIYDTTIRLLKSRNYEDKGAIIYSVCCLFASTRERAQWLLLLDCSMA